MVIKLIAHYSTPPPRILALLSILLILTTPFQPLPATTTATTENTQPSDSAIVIHEQNTPQAYRLRHDLIYLKDRNGRWTRREIKNATRSRKALRQQAHNLAKNENTTVALVLEPIDRPPTPYTLRLLTSRIRVTLKPISNPIAAIQEIAQSHQASFHPTEGAPLLFVLHLPPQADPISIRDALRSHPSVESAEVLLARIAKKKALPNDPLVSQQWHIKNTGSSGAVAGMDANVENVWGTFGGSGTRGQGIRIGIVDDGVQYTHPDISPNYDTATDYDWNDATPNDAAPDVTADFHGTACAGVAAARGHNSTGVTGVAPEATLVGLRLLGDFFDDLDTANAINYLINSGATTIPIKSNSWGPDDDGQTKEAPGPLTQAAFQNAVTNGRGGKGTILVWAAGNGGGPEQDNSNYDGFANSIYTIAVAAMSDQGKRASYSERGANLVVTAPSSSSGRPGIVTTDLVGNNGYNYAGVIGELSDRSYTNDFGGTSSATPVVSGVCALILQTNPNLGWRDVQEILMKTATKNDPSDPEWITNAAGFNFNHNYGAGLVNAQAAVALAATWTNLPPATSQTASNSTTGSIPDNSTTGITRTFTLPTNLRVEHVTVTVNITHARRGQLAIELISPQGTISRLAEKHSDTNPNYTNWTFMTVRNWGENSIGTWTLIVKDLTAGITGTFQNATLTIYGTHTGPVNQPPQIISASVSPTSPAFPDQTLITSVSASDPEGNPITFSYQWQSSSDSIQFNNVPGKTASTLPADAANKGLLWRCRITPNDGNSNGAPFFTAPVLVVPKPVQAVLHGQSYSYDLDLPVQSVDNQPTRAAFINEFSQGPSGNREWIEILVTRQSDLRNWKLADRNSAEITFNNVAFWQNIPAGTLIVIYNGGDTKDPIIPPDDNVLLPDKRLILKHNDSAYFSGNWPALSNTNPEAILIRDANGVIVDALSFNGDAVHLPQLPSVGSATSAAYTGNSETTIDQASAWSISPASAASPGAGNSTANTAFIEDLRNGALLVPVTYQLAAGSDPLPGGLSLNPTTGVISGIVNQPAGGLAKLILQASNGSITQTFAFDLLVGSQHGVYTIPSGKTFHLLAPLSLVGYFNNLGTISNPNLYPLTLQSTYTAWAALKLGNPAASTLDDPDADGLNNLQEYAFNTNPTVSEPAPWQVAEIIVSGQPYLSITYPRRQSPTDLIYTVELSNDLQNWTTGAVLQSTTLVDPQLNLMSDVVRDSLPSSAQPRKFMRIKVQKY
ncbi:MAG: S8 family serine peptidase [Verrucomicrobiae bacterium]|nr:S8 family serine peptidase [Verrucomicrobiae bacterium]